MRSFVFIFSSILVVALAISIWIPSMGRPREAAQRVKCQINLRQLANALGQYMDDHDGVLPSTRGDLVRHRASWTLVDVRPAFQVFVCPNHDEESRAMAANLDALAASLDHPETTIYRYEGGGLTRDQLTPQTILIRESIKNHRGSGMNVPRGDLTVDWIEGNESGRRYR